MVLPEDWMSSVFSLDWQSRPSRDSSTMVADGEIYFFSFSILFLD